MVCSLPKLDTIRKKRKENESKCNETASSTLGDVALLETLSVEMVVKFVWKKKFLHYILEGGRL